MCLMAANGIRTLCGGSRNARRIWSSCYGICFVSKKGTKQRPPDSKPIMKYWAYFISKLLAAACIASLLWAGLVWLVPESPATLYYREVYKQARFAHDLPWTFALLIYSLLCAGLVYLSIWDQRRRCRTCM